MRFALAALGCVSIASSLLAAPMEVVVVHPVEREVTDSADYVGRTQAKESVEIRSRVSGLIEKVLFKEGSDVKKGDALFQIDARLYKAELDKAVAQVLVAEAGLKRGEADYQRVQQTAKTGVGSREGLDRAAADLEAAKAGVIVAKANLEIAKLNLEYTRILSPIAGRIGRATITAGNLVKADGETALATVLALDTLYVYFDVDQRSLLRLIQFNHEKKGSGLIAEVSFLALGKKSAPRQATVDFVDNSVDARTGTVTVRALLANPKGELLPGQFATVRVPLSEPHKALVLPASALTSSGALVVSEKGQIEAKAVARQRIGDEYVIQEGLTKDDWVVLDVRNLKAGDAVKPVQTKEIPVPAKRKEGSPVRR